MWAGLKVDSRCLLCKHQIKERSFLLPCMPLTHILTKINKKLQVITKAATGAVAGSCSLQIWDKLDPLLLLELGFLCPQPQTKLTLACEASPERDFFAQLHAIPIICMQFWVHPLTFTHPHVANCLGCVFLPRCRRRCRVPGRRRRRRRCDGSGDSV